MSLRCKLGLHRPQNGRTGPCLRGCGHVTQTRTNGRVWERHVEPPTRPRPASPFPHHPTDRDLRP